MSTSDRLLVLIPVYDDWTALGLLLPRLGQALTRDGLSAEILVIDDASQIAADAILPSPGITATHVVSLRRNVGHQRAIAIGLAYAEEHFPGAHVVVMDADGEDDPVHVPRLYEKCREERFAKIVFARRRKRSEGPRFVFFYALYRWLYRLMTGMDIRVGNFSIVPHAVLRRLVGVSEIWSHYVGGVMKARLPYATVPCDRAPRLAGRSRMNLVSLVTHGLSAIAVNGDVLGVRALMATCALIVAMITAIVVAVGIRLYTNLAIPGWATYVVALATVILIEAIILSLFFIFTILSGRNQVNFIPKRDYHHFVLDVTSSPAHV
ncbi:MAG TPA: glycosyltransferase [Thermoanaerobaculia bacterium]